MQTQQNYADILKKITLFNNVSDAHIDIVSKNLVERTYLSSQAIFLDGSTEGAIYLIASGKIKISKHTKHNTESILGILHEGDYFGEMEMIDGLPRSASASALSDSKILLLKKNEFDFLIKNSNPFALNILNTLAIRLRTINETFITDMDRYSEWTNSRILRLHQLIEGVKIINSATDLDTMLTQMLNIVIKNIDADRGRLYLTDINKKEIWTRVFEEKKYSEIRFPYGSGIAGTVALTGEVINISESKSDARFDLKTERIDGYAISSTLCVPIKNRTENIIGVFQLFNKKKGPFTKTDHEFISALSQHAAIAIEKFLSLKQLIQSNQLSILGKLSHTIIDDLKNPIATLNRISQSLKNRDDNKSIAIIIESAIHQIDQFTSKAKGILEFSSVDKETNLQEIDIRQFIDVVLFFIEKDFNSKNISINKKISCEGIYQLDPEKIMRALHNIAGNAADAMANGGKLTFSISEENNKLIFEISDTGIGMNEEVKAKIFEPFYTSGKEYNTGLGLSIVKNIIDNHEGEIEVASHPGKGTIVKIKIPKK